MGESRNSKSCQIKLAQGTNWYVYLLSMSGQWRTAKIEDRNTILECLEDGNYRPYASGTRYLNAKGLIEGPLIEVLIENLKQYEIFELPRQNRRSPQKYQFVIRHEDPELL